jgi:translation initiation factor 3 subunit M
LLKVFQEGKLDEYHSFLNAHGGEAKVLQPYGLSSETCIRQMRILSLCSLAAEHEEIPYSVVAKTLLLPSVDEVESWVIAAVSSGLLSAKMDQLQQKVMVERCVVRRFDTEQWKRLQSRLKVWKENVGGVINGLKQSQNGSQLSSN